MSKVSIAFKPRLCPKCGGKMGRDAKEICHKCQAKENLKNHTKRHSQEIKDYARKLRDKGRKYKSIQKSIKRKFDIKVSEGTICNWCKNPKRKNGLRCHCGAILKCKNPDEVKGNSVIFECSRCHCIYRLIIVRKSVECAKKQYEGKMKSLKEIRKKKRRYKKR